MAADISPFVADAQKLQDQTGIPASITLGQIILESSGSNAGGLSGLAADAHNLFGIKGSGNAGSVYMPTNEYNSDGSSYSTSAAFRKYTDYYASMVDHAQLLSGDRYAQHLKSATSINDYANGILAGGYATDPNYANDLLGIISSHNLHQYDTGNFTFTPMSGSGGGSAAPATDPHGWINGMLQSLTHTILILVILIAGIAFFMQAFPATQDVAKTAAKAALL